jgi:8-oxo-dGTP pyrophosphatase MutT (NUDIX family)
VAGPRARLLLRAPKDWLGIVRWGAGRPTPDDRALVHGVIEGEGGVLLALRRELRGWELPGGRVEPGEAEAFALVREVEEETGLRVEPLAFVGEYSRTGFASHRARVHRCRVVGGTLRPSAEAPAVAWFRTDALPATVFPWFRRPLEDALRGATGERCHEHLGLRAIACGLVIDLRERWRATGA